MAHYTKTTKSTYTTTSTGGMPTTAGIMLGGIPTTTTYTTTPTYTYSTGPMITQYTSTTSSGGGIPIVTTPTLRSAGFTTSLGMPRAVGLGTRLSMNPMVMSPSVVRVPVLGSPLTGYTTTTAMAAPATITTGGAGAKMGISTHKEVAQHASAFPSFSSDSSIDLNGVHCQGHIEVTGDKVTKATNIFLGTGPFPLSAETLEVTPEMAVMATHPDIKAHVPDVPSEEFPTGLTLRKMRELLNLADESKPVYLALPGQDAALVVEQNGQLMFMQANVI